MTKSEIAELETRLARLKREEAEASARDSSLYMQMLHGKDPNEYGIWEIFGEDPNCDLGGCHHEPHLDTVEGTYEKAVTYALTLPRFIQWGSGGRIVKYNVPQIKKL